MSIDLAKRLVFALSITGFAASLQKHSCGKTPGTTFGAQQRRKPPKGKRMDPKKVFIYGFFGLFGAIILSLLSAVGGFAGAGVSLLIISVFGNVLISSLIGGACAAIAFHALIQGVDTFLIKAADQKSQKSGQEVKPPSLAQDRRYLWGSVSYFISTVIGVNFILSLIADPTWGVIATIVGSGILGLAGLGLVVKLKLWEPNLKQKDEQR